MQNTVTLKNIASKLGVSVSTVSKALNDSYEISNSTKKRIITAAKVLNYKPNFYAKSLKKREKLIIGVIVPSLKEEFYLNLVTGITEESYKQGHLIMVYQTGDTVEKEISYTRLLSRDIIDGLIYSSNAKKEENIYLEKLLKEDLLPIELMQRTTQKNFHDFEENGTVKEVDLGRELVNKIIDRINS
ncbi:Transcriptional regulator, LacI family [Tenacibaculum sp. 190130A14a]|uniref:Transcriptional regulator, LacI family n=1 Tax=Tenacibaculum polynesiense TaxID=3137857 RepID=A0ABP1EU09_9FLAO